MQTETRHPTRARWDPATSPAAVRKQHEADRRRDAQQARANDAELAAIVAESARLSAHHASGFYTPTQRALTLALQRQQLAGAAPPAKTPARRGINPQDVYTARREHRDGAGGSLSPASRPLSFSDVAARYYGAGVGAEDAGLIATSARGGR